MLRAALLGNGGIAKEHKKAYAQLGEIVKLSAVCDIQPERLTEFGDISTYVDIDALLESERGKLDYVDICLPTYLHAEVSIKALQTGFHVLCEKPMALNYELAQKMRDTARACGKTLMIAHVNRFMSERAWIKSVIDSGELGKVRSAEFYREGGSRQPMGYKNWFRDEKLSGGAILDTHVHDVDLVFWMFGLPRSVSAVAANVIEGGGYDALSVNYIYDDDRFVHAFCDWTIAHNKFNTRCMRVNFDKGYIFADKTAGRQAFCQVNEDGTTIDLADKLKSDGFYNEIEYYARCLQTGQPVTRCLPESSAESIRIVVAEVQSANAGGLLIEV